MLIPKCLTERRQGPQGLGHTRPEPGCVREFEQESVADQIGTKVLEGDLPWLIINEVEKRLVDLLPRHERIRDPPSEQAVLLGFKSGESLCMQLWR
jgi:hypothetical protein